ncbi:MAG: helix-turn-helix domain-containing protein [Silicimonas sp.]|nr:helix-turn-helix domain-containing protein [Silicimonas sp.]
MAIDPPGRKIDRAIGAALKDLRQQRGLSARGLAETSGISAAMVSRIENGLVSPSIGTLEALAAALEVPIVSLFRDARTDHTDFTLVRAGEGLTSTRLAEGHRHEYVNLATHMRKDLQFIARRVTLTRAGGQPPRYVGHGVVFIEVIEGEAVYCYGKTRLNLGAGDTLSIDAELNHGFEEVLSDRFVFLSVQAERP